MASDVLIVPNDRGGYSITIDGTDVSYFVNEFSLHVEGGKKPIVTLVVRADRVRAGLPQAIVDAVQGNVSREC